MSHHAPLLVSFNCKVGNFAKSDRLYSVLQQINQISNIWLKNITNSFKKKTDRQITKLNKEMGAIIED